MTIIFNGITVNDVVMNGDPQAQVYHNDTLVHDRPPGPETGWSGDSIRPYRTGGNDSSIGIGASTSDPLFLEAKMSRFSGEHCRMGLIAWDHGLGKFVASAVTVEVGMAEMPYRYVQILISPDGLGLAHTIVTFMDYSFPCGRVAQGLTIHSYAVYDPYTKKFSGEAHTSGAMGDAPNHQYLQTNAEGQIRVAGEMWDGGYTEGPWISLT